MTEHLLKVAESNNAYVSLYRRVDFSMTLEPAFLSVLRL